MYPIVLIPCSFLSMHALAVVRERRYPKSCGFTSPGIKCLSWMRAAPCRDFFHIEMYINFGFWFVGVMAPAVGSCRKMELLCQIISTQAFFDKRILTPQKQFVFLNL